MNIYQLDELINSLNPIEDKDLIEFYTKKRKELLEQISKTINNKLKEL
jgi:phosphoglycerate-specific signal transduction histidine kinase